MSATFALLEQTIKSLPQDVLLVLQEPAQVVKPVLSARSESTASGGRMSATYALLEQTTRLLPQDVLLAHQEPSHLAMLALSAKKESMQSLVPLLALPVQEMESTRQRKDR
jgi:hypothetical protein